MLASDTGTIIQGNYIGTDVNGTVDLGNGHPTGLSGIEMGFTTTAAPIGGPNPGEPNTLIAFSGCAGCAGPKFRRRHPRRFQQHAQNRILRNSIFNNAHLGIDLLGGSENAFGVTANDNCDGDSSPNNLQNFPVITSAQTSGAVTTIAGSLNSTANSTFRVDFYSNPWCNITGNGQGKTHLGFTTVNTDGTCNVPFQAMLNLVLPPGVVSATATDAAGNTSEFSACRQSVVPPAVPVGSVVSRKTHGGAGAFAVDLPLSGTPGIECRTGGANLNHTIVFTFANPLASVGGASVTSGNGSVASAVIGSDAREFIVTLAPRWDRCPIRHRHFGEHLLCRQCEQRDLRRTRPPGRRHQWQRQRQRRRRAGNAQPWRPTRGCDQLPLRCQRGWFHQQRRHRGRARARRHRPAIAPCRANFPRCG